MNRGRRAEKIFVDDHDHHIFIKLLIETSDAWNVRISAYCLMPNHYHMLINTPEANISRVMRHINGVYTQRFNSRHGCDGQLFRGRYKSILVSGNTYLLQLVRYIHRNPLKAGMVAKLNAYAWSSHRAYVSVAKKWNWLYKDFILGILTSEKRHQIGVYRKFMAMENQDQVSGILDCKKWPSLLGPQDFVDRVKSMYRDFKEVEETPQMRELYIDTETILSQVSDYYGITHDDLNTARRGQFNEPRNVAIYLLRRLRRDSLSEIGRVFQIDKYSSVSSIIERLKLRIGADPQLKKRIEDLKHRTYMSQGQT